MPRDLADLSRAPHLVSISVDELTAEADLECVRLDDCAVVEAQARNARFSESVVTASTFDHGTLRNSHFADVWFRGVRWVGTDLSETGWMDVELGECALSGVEAVGAAFRRMRFVNCKFESVDLRATVLRDVEFHECVLRDVDFGEAKLTNVTFPGSVLADVALPKARLANVDLRGAVRLGFVAGIDALRGATISNSQLLDLAPLFAASIGVTVKDG